MSDDQDGRYDADARRETDAPNDAASPRLTPYELVFGHDSFETERFPAIRDEIEARGARAASPERFLMLGQATELLRELAPDEAGIDVYGRYGALLYQAFNFWRFERRLLVADAALLRHVAADFPAVGTWELTPPYPAGYLQLPRHLFWARVDETSPPEPVDGFFWTMIGTEDPTMPPYERLDLLLAVGMRPGRPGFGTVPIMAVLNAAPLGHWADADARPDGRDFANILPGGELQDWYALVNELEVLKLISRLFWYVALNPASLGEREHAAAAPASAQHALPPGELPFQPIRRVADG